MQGSPQRSEFAWRADRKQHGENYVSRQQTSKNSDGAKGSYSVQLHFCALHWYCTKVKNGSNQGSGVYARLCYQPVLLMASKSLHLAGKSVWGGKSQMRVLKPELRAHCRELLARVVKVCVSVLSL